MVSYQAFVWLPILIYVILNQYIIFPQKFTNSGRWKEYFRRMNEYDKWMHISEEYWYFHVPGISCPLHLQPKLPVGYNYKCWVMDKKVAEEKIAPLPTTRTMIVPSFYTILMDFSGPFLLCDTVRLNLWDSLQFNYHTWMPRGDLIWPRITINCCCRRCCTVSC